MGQLKGVWDNASNFGRVVIVGTAVLIVLLVVGAAIGDSENADRGDVVSAPATEADSGPSEKELQEVQHARRERKIAERGASEQQREETPQGAQEADTQLEPSVEQRVREALGDSVSSDVAVGDSEVRSVDVTGHLLDITLSTPKGGFEGPSTNDIDGLVSAAFAKVYEDADWDGAVYVEFRGGLVDSATGRSLPHAPTANYRIERSRAEQIDWSDDEVLFVIDWSIYRGLCHPALKGC